MTNPPPPELTSSERPVQPTIARAKSYRVRRAITVLIALGLIGGGVYEIYLWKRTPAVIPTIHAEGSLKQKPEQPGGIDIPNQDVTAYQQIDNSEAKPVQGEHLLPPPETPQASAPAAPPSEISPPVQPAAPGTASIENLISPPAVPIQTTVTPPKPATGEGIATPAPAVPANTAPAPVQVPAPGPAAAVQKTEAATPEPVVSAAPAAPVQPAAAAEATPSVPAAPAVKSESDTPRKPAAGKDGYHVQLASIPDEEMAMHEMGRMQAKYESQLNGSKLHLVKADLGARGIYYRVQSNTMTDTDARDVCAALKNLKAGCIVVKP